MGKTLLALLACTVAFPVWAQDSTETAATETDWSVFVEEDPTQCWVVSAPKTIRNTRDGAEVEARRGDIRLFVSYWPDEDKKGEVSATGGYPYRDGSTVTMTIGEESFELFTDGELAWSSGPEEDQKIIAEMKGGAQAVLVGISGRGTRTEDTFSLLGFTAAIDEAQSRCGG